MKECTMTAKTVEEAIELACDRIGLPREEVEIAVSYTHLDDLSFLQDLGFQMGGNAQF